MTTVFFTTTLFVSAVSFFVGYHIMKIKRIELNIYHVCALVIIAIFIAMGI